MSRQYQEVRKDLARMGQDCRGDIGGGGHERNFYLRIDLCHSVRLFQSSGDPCGGRPAAERFRKSSQKPACMKASTRCPSICTRRGSSFWITPGLLRPRSGLNCLRRFESESLKKSSGGGRRGRRYVINTKGEIFKKWEPSDPSVFPWSADWNTRIWRCWMEPAVNPSAR